MYSSNPTSDPEFTQETSFNEPIANITDVTLVVEEQKMYACKKILAQYSSYFYDLFCGDNADKNKQEYEITDTTCDSFRMFLKLLYSRNVNINMNNFQSLAELSFRFKADHCLEECERFLIKQDIAPGLKLRHAQGFNFKVLHDYVLESYRTSDSVKTLEKDANYEHFGPETKLAILERIDEINRGGEKFKNVVLGTNGSHAITVFGVSWKFNVQKFSCGMTVATECDLHDNLNPWKCRVNFQFFCCSKQKSESKETIYCDSEKITTFTSYKSCLYDYDYSYGSDRFCCIRIYPIYGVHEQRSTSFQEIRPKLTDVVLSVADKKFHVSKQILANQSSYFETMFYSDFAEKGKQEIELKEVDATEFETFLQFIYHPSRLVSAEIIDGLLELSQYYDAPLILEKCMAFLEIKGSMNDAMKMKIAEKYHFTSLLEQLVSTINTYDDFVKVSQLEGFKELKDDTIGKIAKNVLKI